MMMSWIHHHSSETAKMTIQQNKKTIFSAVDQACQKAGRRREEVEIVAVTKYVDSSIAKELIDAGVTHLAENRVDKFLEKYHTLSKEKITWHLIGNLQRRKVKDVINYVDVFHALDSVKLAREIQKRANHPIDCLLEVNFSGEESKHGFAPDQVDQAIEELRGLDRIRLIGVMTMAPIDADTETLDRLFGQAKLLQESLQERKIPQMPFTELSMGMSRDYPEAIANGATMVRIGTAFFK